LNNPFIIRQCQHISKQISPSEEVGQEQIVAACHQILLRTPTAAEAQQLTDYAKRHGLANVCHLLTNSNEFLHLD
jgi:hypothetical protein